MRSLTDAPFFNPLDPAFQADPLPVYAQLREQSSVVQTPVGAGVVRRDAAQQLLTDSRVTTALVMMSRAQGLTEGPVAELIGATVLALDGEDHARVRRLVARSFTPKAADRHRPLMRELVNELVDGFASDGHCEFVTQFADQFPIQVICEVLGVPRERHADFARWGSDSTYVLSLNLSAHLNEVIESASAVIDYIDDLINERRASPRDDLVTGLIQASEDGDVLSQLELRAMIGGLGFAGYDTTRNQLGRAMFLFAQNPDQWDLLGDNPDLAAGAVNEVMRVAGVIDGVPRSATADIEVDGWLIPAGTFVFLSMASANHDAEVYDDASEFDITRRAAPNLTFGAGPHFCLGANLARAEMEEALQILATRLPHIRLDDVPTWRSDTGIFGPALMPLAFDPAPQHLE